MIDDSKIRLLSELIGKVSMMEATKKMALSIVYKKLGGVLYGEGEEQKIAEDALSECVMKLLTDINEGTNRDKLESLSVGVDARPTQQHPIYYYLRTSVERYCDTRLRRWSNINEQGKYGARARKTLDTNKENESDPWDDIETHDIDFSAMDTEKIIPMLIERGLKNSEIDVIKQHLDGQSFAEIARGTDISANGLGKRFSRACEKAGIENLEDYA